MFVCVAGKNDISVDVLHYLYENYRDRYELGVVCNKNETGIDTWQKSLRKYAQEHEITEYTLDDVYRKENQIFLSLEFDRIVNTERFADARLYTIHFSLLPKYRGMYTSALPLLHGEKEVGVTLHYIDHGIDTGDIIAQRVIPVEYEDTARDLYLKYIHEGTELVISNLEDIFCGRETSVPQMSEGATYYAKDAINYANLDIRLNCTADELRNQIRAFCFPEYQLPIVYGREIARANITNQRSMRKAGTIVKETTEYLQVATVDYDVELYFAS